MKIHNKKYSKKNKETIWRKKCRLNYSADAEVDSLAKYCLSRIIGEALIAISLFCILSSVVDVVEGLKVDFFVIVLPYNEAAKVVQQNSFGFAFDFGFEGGSFGLLTPFFKGISLYALILYKVQFLIIRSHFNVFLKMFQ